MSPNELEPIQTHRPAIGDREIAAAVFVLRSALTNARSRAHACDAASRPVEV